MLRERRPRSTRESNRSAWFFFPFFFLQLCRSSRCSRSYIPYLFLIYVDLSNSERNSFYTPFSNPIWKSIESRAFFKKNLTTWVFMYVLSNYKRIWKINKNLVWIGIGENTQHSPNISKKESPLPMTFLPTLRMSSVQV